MLAELGREISGLQGIDLGNAEVCAHSVWHISSRCMPLPLFLAFSCLDAAAPPSLRSQSRRESASLLESVGQGMDVDAELRREISGLQGIDLGNAEVCARSVCVSPSLCLVLVQPRPLLSALNPGATVQVFSSQ